MSTKITSTVPFDGTKEQYDKLMALIETYKDVDGPVMPVMQGAQEIYGYLPEEVQLIIAKGLGMSLAHVYGVATFYSQFNLNPKGKYKVSVCLGTACYVKEAQKVFDELVKVMGVNNGDCTSDMLFSLDATRCLGCCGLAPVIMINDDVYGRLAPADVAGIIDKYKAQG